jgi:NAD(P)-dependent dehydrogenase (short-subunit alcohol dehydrogenase family)
LKNSAMQKVFVTGAGGGLGFAIAKAFVDDGATVGMLDIDEALLDKAVSTLPAGHAIPFAGDVSDRKAVNKAIDDFAKKAGGLDVLVNNAVYFYYAPLVDMPEPTVGKMIDVGLKGAIWSLQAATPHLIARGKGTIINLSSIAVSIAIANAAVYSSIKGALDTLTRQQAVELAKHGITVNALAPGSVVTPGASTVIDANGWRRRAERTPLKRLATPEEIGAVAVFLAFGSRTQYHRRHAQDRCRRHYFGFMKDWPSAHGASQAIDFFGLSFLSIMGATAKIFPLFFN